MEVGRSKRVITTKIWEQVLLIAAYSTHACIMSTPPIQDVNFKKILVLSYTYFFCFFHIFSS